MDPQPDPQSSQEPSPSPPSAPTAQTTARAYSGAMEAVLSILIGAGLGWWADSALGSEPWGVVVGLGIGFAAFVRRLLRVQHAAAEAPEPAEREESD